MAHGNLVKICNFDIICSKSEIKSRNLGLFHYNIKKECCANKYVVKMRSYQRSVGQDFLLNVSQSSVSRCIREIASIMDKYLLTRYIKFPSTVEEKQAILSRVQIPWDHRRH
ncbi:uncharacterized protein LOC118752134 [Rhagoletis pomonella]|uniref:uncharacterized protein LOC118752134 n=1 Tax=Rhagoletis pomonella TaxID=28610 RepID=UPI0017808D44|nr:uncharacterized protein LOC118752134 [Rhagoletis pomonella]